MSNYIVTNSITSYIIIFEKFFTLIKGDISLDKATRILNILTLLLNGHVVTQEDLDRFTNVSKNLFNVILIQLIHFL